MPASISGNTMHNSIRTLVQPGSINSGISWIRPGNQCEDGIYTAIFFCDAADAMLNIFFHT